MAKLYEQVAQRILTGIEQGIYQSGERLPGIRLLQQQFGVSISTIVEAYRRLEDQGLIEARPRSGFFVRPYSKRLPTQLDISTPPQQPLPVTGQALALRLVQAANNPTIIQLGAAVPDPTFLPIKTVSQALINSLRLHPIPCARYEFPPGHLALRKQLARRMLELGCKTASEEIIITGGAQESLTLALRATTQPGDIVAIESPTFYGLLQVIESLGIKALEIPTHPQQGISLDALRLAIAQWPIKACILVPNFSNPLGYLMPDAAKKECVELLALHNIPLVEDDVYGDLGFGLQRPSVAKSWDKSGNVIYCTSFSKTISPGLRLGWIMPGRFFEKIEYLKYVLNLASATVSQLAVAQLLEKNTHERYLRRVRRQYATAVNRMINAVNLIFPEGCKISQPEGGFVIWIELPAKVDALLLCQQAYTEGISLAPGPLFSASQRYGHCIRLNCALPWSDELEWALKRIGYLANKLAEI